MNNIMNNIIINLIREVKYISKQTEQNDFLLERNRMPQLAGESWRSFIGEGSHEGDDEGTVVILGGGSERVSF
jgi:hypothetical protein